MNDSGLVSDFKSLVFSPRKLFAFFESYEKPNTWMIFKILWGFFIVSVITQAVLGYQSLSDWNSAELNFSFNGMSAPDFISGFWNSLKPLLIWLKIWGVLLHPFLALSKILSWAGLTFIILDLIGAKPERIGFTKLFLVFCLVNWLQIFQTLSIFAWVWIFLLSLFAVERIYSVTKTQAFFAIAGSFWIVMGGIYLLTIAGIGALFAAI